MRFTRIKLTVCEGCTGKIPRPIFYLQTRDGDTEDIFCRGMYSSGNIARTKVSIKNMSWNLPLSPGVYILISNINCRKKTSGTIPNKILKLAANDCYTALTD